MKKNVRIILWGFGAMGSTIARILLSKKGVEICGVCDIAEDRANREVGELLHLSDPDRCPVLVHDDMEELLSRLEGEDPAGRAADLAILATDSYVSGAYDKIMLLLKHRINLISTAEQMAYPWASEPERAKAIDRAAKKAGVSVLGTGINPGMMMDLLALVLTGACSEVESIKAERRNSLSPYGPTVMDEQGVGLSAERFEERSARGKIAGHVGFQESIAMICDGLGWVPSAPSQEHAEAIIAKKARKSDYAAAGAGDVAGVLMTGSGWVEGREKIRMIHPQQIEPEAEGISTGDYIEIKGNPDISMAIEPEVSGGIGTAAICVNMIPQTLNAPSGLQTMIDLPIPRAIMGDMRERIREDR